MLSNKIVHFCNSKSWAQSEKYFSSFLHSTEKDYLFLSVIAFVDEFVRDRSRARLSDAIYITLANLSLPMLSTKKSKILLCSAPPGAPKHEVYDVVLVKPLMDLERGLFKSFFYPLQKVISFVGTLHCVIADDIGARELMCKLSPNCKNASRFFDDTLGSCDFSKVVHIDERVKHLKNPEEHLSLVESLSVLNSHVCSFFFYSIVDREFFKLTRVRASEGKEKLMLLKQVINGLLLK